MVLPIITLITLIKLITIITLPIKNIWIQILISFFRSIRLKKKLLTEGQATCRLVSCVYFKTSASAGLTGVSSAILDDGPQAGPARSSGVSQAGGRGRRTYGIAVAFFVKYNIRVSGEWLENVTESRMRMEQGAMMVTRGGSQYGPRHANDTCNLQ